MRYALRAKRTSDLLRVRHDPGPIRPEMPRAEIPYYDRCVALLPMCGEPSTVDFADYSPYRHAVTTNGAVHRSSDQSRYGYGTSGKFDGSGDYLSIADGPDLQFSTDPFTIEAWFYVDGARVARGIAAKGTASTNGWAFQIGSAGKLEFFYNASTAITASTLRPQNAWAHVAVTRDAWSIIRLFLDGALDGQGTCTANFNQTNNLIIGANRTTSTGSWLGWLSDVAVYNGVAKYVAAFAPPQRPFLRR